MSWRHHYPFESNFHSLGSRRIHYLDEGREHSGETMLMIHGNPTWSFYYRDLVAAFKDRVRCVAPDHLGMGLSDKPRDAAYDLRMHIDHLVGLIQQLDLQRIHLLVHIS